MPPISGSGWVDFNQQKPVQQKKVFEYKRDTTKKRVYGYHQDESSGDMDSYQVVPIEQVEKRDRHSGAPQRGSKKKRYNNDSSVSKFDDQKKSYN